jgi:hypothetical protein
MPHKILARKLGPIQSRTNYQSCNVLRSSETLRAGLANRWHESEDELWSALPKRPSCQVRQFPWRARCARVFDNPERSSIGFLCALSGETESPMEVTESGSSAEEILEFSAWEHRVILRIARVRRL